MAAANQMTEISDDVYRIAFADVLADKYEFKFVANESWEVSWGSSSGDPVISGQTYGAEFDARPNIVMNVMSDGSAVTITLDLSGDTATFTVVVKEKHIHSWATEWTTDDTGHWYDCTATENCDGTKGSYAEHTPNTDDGDCTTAVICSVCQVVTTPAKDAHTPENNNCTDCDIHLHDGTTTFIPWTAESGEVAPGNYYLSDTVPAIVGDIQISGNVSLCLNGKTLALGGNKITVPSGAALNLHDCQSGGSITASGTAISLTGGTISAGSYSGNALKVEVKNPTEDMVVIQDTTDTSLFTVTNRGYTLEPTDEGNLVMAELEPFSLDIYYDIVGAEYKIDGHDANSHVYPTDIVTLTIRPLDGRKFLTLPTVTLENNVATVSPFVKQADGSYTCTLSNFTGTVYLTICAAGVYTKTNVSYMDSDGTTKTTPEGVEVAVVENITSTLTTGWYVVEEDFLPGSTSKSIAIQGDVKLILQGRLNNISSILRVESNDTLTVYGKSMQSGTLSASNIECGVTLNSGNLKVTGKMERNLTMNGGIAQVMGSITSSTENGGILFEGMVGEVLGNITLTEPFALEEYTTGTSLTIPEGKTLTLDTSSSSRISADTTLYVNGSLVIPEGKTLENYGSIVIRGTATGSIENNGTIQCGDLIVAGGTYGTDFAYAPTNRILHIHNGANVTLSMGKDADGNTLQTAQGMIYAGGTASVLLMDVNLETPGTPLFLYSNAKCTLRLAGTNTLTSTDDTGRFFGIQLGSGATLTFEGTRNDKLNVNNTANPAICGNGNLVINGGDITATVAAEKFNIDCDSLTVNQGTLNLTQSNSPGSALGLRTDAFTVTEGSIYTNNLPMGCGCSENDTCTHTCTITGGYMEADNIRFGSITVNDTTGEEDASGFKTLVHASNFHAANTITISGQNTDVGSMLYAKSVEIQSCKQVRALLISAETVTISGGIVVSSNITGTASIAVSGGNVNVLNQSNWGENYNGTINGGTVTISGGAVTAEGAINGTFSTTENGTAFVSAGSIADNDDTSAWSGIIYDGTTGRVYGGSDKAIQLSTSAKAPAGSTLTIPEGVKLTFAEGAFLEIPQGAEVMAECEISGPEKQPGGPGPTCGFTGYGNFHHMKPTLLVYPEAFYYTGEYLPHEIRYSHNPIYWNGAVFQVPDQYYSDGLLEWTSTITHENGEIVPHHKIVNAGTYTVTAVYTDPATKEEIFRISETFQVKQSGTDFAVGIQTFLGETATTTFTYGDAVTVKVTPEATGQAPAARMRTMAAPTANQMAIFLGETQLTDAQTVTEGQTLTFTVTDLNAGDHTLTAKYVGDTNMAGHEESVDITVNKASLTGVSVEQSGTLTYNGRLQTAVYQETATALGEKSVTFTFSTAKNGDYTAAIPQFKDAGAHTVYYKASADQHLDATGHFIVTIDPRLLEIDSVTIEEKTYDGTTDAQVRSVTFRGGQESDSFTLGNDYTVTAHFTDPNAGTGKTANVTVTLTNTNYTLGSAATCQVTGLTVNKAPQNAPQVSGSYAVSTTDPDTFAYTLTAVEGAEYSKDGQVWQDSNVFDGIPVDSVITFQARMKERENYVSSPAATTGEVVFLRLSRKEVPNLEVKVTGENGDRTITITPVEGAEYAFGDEPWGTSNTISGQDGIVKVQIRYAQTPTLLASETVSREVDTRKQEQQPLVMGELGEKTYGDPAFDLTVSGGSGTGTLQWKSSDPEVLRISDAKATILKPGKVTITVTKEADQDYNAAQQTVELTIGKKDLTIAADSYQVHMDDPMPTLTYIVTELAQGDTFTGPSLSTTAKDTRTGGEFEIAISGGTLTNRDCYNVVYQKGTLTVIPHKWAQGWTNDDGYHWHICQEAHCPILDNSSKEGYGPHIDSGKGICQDCGYFMDADQVETRVEQTAITQVPESLREQFSSPQAIQAELSRVLTTDTGYSAANVATCDVTLQFSTDGGTTWIDATEANFPAEGITVVLSYPAGTGPNTHDFKVTHMFTVTSEKLGTEAGDTETPPVTKLASGIQVTLKGLSPVGISWKQLPAADSGSQEPDQEQEPTYDSDCPKTGDITKTGLWLGIGAVGLLGLIGSIAAKKHFRKRK